jgi:hypothetical protein
MSCTPIRLTALALGLPVGLLAQEPRRSTAEQREAVSITVYNQNFGLVREVRTVDLARGRTPLEFQDVAGQIEPYTVIIRAPGSGPFRVLEQNYQYDLLNPEQLLNKYVGRQVKVYRWNSVTGRDEPFDAEVLSAQGPVLRIGSEITYGFPGRLSFPEIPENLISRPTLMWLLESDGGQRQLEVSYLTKGMNWRADYVMVVNAADTQGDLTGWVTLDNQSGTGYRNAQLKLVAGDVQRIRDEQNKVQLEGITVGFSGAGTPLMTEEGLFEYHLYTLERPATVLNNEQKQVTMLEGTGIGLKKRLILPGQPWWYRSQTGEIASNQKVGVFMEFANSEANRLGMPLPKGIVRVYKADQSGAQQFIGEDQIDHTPRDEMVRIKMGEAFDVVADRRQMVWRALGTCQSESNWEIDIRNHKDTAEEVDVMEPVGGDWTIEESSHGWERIDAATFRFRVSVPARGATKITYRVRVRWC